MCGITSTKVLLELYARIMVRAPWRRRALGGEVWFQDAIPLPGGVEAAFIGYPGYVFTLGLKRQCHGQEEQDKPLPLSFSPAHRQFTISPSFPLSALATGLGIGCPLQGFPN